MTLKTPLAEALSEVVQPKLSEIGWNTGGVDDSALGEYIILMLVNGKTQEQIAAELSNDLLNLEPDNSGATDFSRWLFEQVEILSNQLKGTSSSNPQSVPEAQGSSSQPDSGRPLGIERIHSIADGHEDLDMADAVDGVTMCVIPLPTTLIVTVTNEFIQTYRPEVDAQWITEREQEADRADF